MSARTANFSPAGFFSILLFLATFLSALHLTGIPVHAAQATLTWDAPTTYVDGTPVAGLGGYKVYYGTTSGNYSQNTDVGNTTNYTLSGLNGGTTYYFAVTAYDASGIVSGFSNQVAYTTAAEAPSTALYTLSASAGSGGSITPSGAVVISQGTSQTYTITPSTGYKVAGVTVDGISVGPVTSYTFTNVNANHSIAASFQAVTSSTSYTISATAYSNGSISPSGTTSVVSGASKTFTITPAAGYQVSIVKVDGVSVGTPTGYTFRDVTANHTIAVSFKTATTATTASHTITATAYSNGSISPSGATTVTSGGSKTYTITPRSGYQISVVKVDGVSVGTPTSYTFRNVTSNHTIAVSFKTATTATTATRTITATAYSNGSISPSGATSVTYGGSKTFTITPRSGYTVSVVKVDGVSVGTPTSYTFRNVTTNHTIAVSFKLK